MRKDSSREDREVLPRSKCMLAKLLFVRSDTYVLASFAQLPPLMDLLSLLPATDDLHKLENISANFIANRSQSLTEHKSYDMLSYFVSYHRAFSPSPRSLVRS